VRVAAIEELASLTATQRGVVERLGQWSSAEERQLLRAYWLDDGDVMIAPWNCSTSWACRMSSIAVARKLHPSP
jgi:hypothetical protein